MNLDLFGTVDGDLLYHPGYSFGMHMGEQEGWSHGVVVTDRWVERCVRECSLPVVIDNGAFPAWRDGKTLSLSEQLDSIWHCVSVAGSRVARIIAPDVIGDARATYARICGSIGELANYRMKLLLPMQEGCNTARLVDLARNIGAGLFIGGASKSWKIKQVMRVRALDSFIYVHVGRVGRFHELEQCARAGADAFDTTSFMRRQHSNVAIDWRPRFHQFCKRVGP